MQAPYCLDWYDRETPLIIIWNLFLLRKHRKKQCAIRSLWDIRLQSYIFMVAKCVTGFTLCDPPLVEFAHNDIGRNIDDRIPKATKQWEQILLRRFFYQITLEV